MEIYTGVGGEVIFKKYSPVGELSAFAEDYAEAMAKGSRLTAAICDEDVVVAAAGPNKKDILGKEISEELRTLMKDRSKYTGGSGGMAVCAEGGLIVAVAYPIISCGDVGGAVMLVGSGQEAATDSDVKLALAAAEFLGRQMED